MRSVLIFAAIGLCCASVFGKQVAVLVDVSGTMAHYGDWQPEAVSLIRAITSGDLAAIRSDRWKQTGDTGHLSEFAVLSGDSIQLVRFGSLQKDAFPFFSAIQEISNLRDLESAFPLNHSLFQEPKTNKSLALAVGAQLVTHDNVANLVVVSDFLEDRKLTAAQEDFLIGFESKSEITMPVIWNWIPDQNVQLKLLHVRFSNNQAGTTAAETSSIQLLSPTINDGQVRSVQFRWKKTGPGEVRSYLARVFDSGTRKLVFERSAISPAVLWAPAESGHFQWKVTAILDNDAQVESATAALTVPGSSHMGLVFFILFVALCVAGAWFYARWNRLRGEPVYASGREKEEH